MRHRVLLVDDDPIVLVVIGEVLSEHFEVRTASSAAEAMTIARRELPFAVVVSDLCMPGMDGLTLLAHLAEVSPATVPMVLTAHATLDAAMTAVNESHVFGFFSKDADLEILVDGVRKAAKRHEALAGRVRPGGPAGPGGELLSREEIDFLTGGQ